MDVIHILVLLTITLHCNGVNVFEAIAQLKKHGKARSKFKSPKIMRRFNIPNEPSVIIGAPSYPYHLPPAVPILPGHTLIRPTVGMLKSSIKFPHREQENGSGVYGHFENLGLKYDGKNERVLYTGFRRSQPQSQKLNTRRSRNGPYSRHLEMYSPNNKKNSLNMKYQSPMGIKVLEIYPSQVFSKNKKQINNLKRLSQEAQNYNVHERTWKALNSKIGRYDQKSPRHQEKSLRFLNEIPSPSIHTPSNYFYQPVLIKEVKEIDLLNVFRIISSLRRQEREHEENEEEKEETKLLYIPGTAKYGDFGLEDSDSDSESPNKTELFWKTKSDFEEFDGTS